MEQHETEDSKPIVKTATRHRHQWTKSVEFRGQKYCEGCGKFKVKRKGKWVVEL